MTPRAYLVIVLFCLTSVVVRLTAHNIRTRSIKACNMCLVMRQKEARLAYGNRFTPCQYITLFYYKSSMTACLRPSPPRGEDDKRVEMSELAEVDELYNQKTAQEKRDARAKERRERDRLQAEQVKEVAERKAEEERQRLARDY